MTQDRQQEWKRESLSGEGPQQPHGVHYAAAHGSKKEEKGEPSKQTK